MIRANRMDHINLTVNNIAETTGFYQRLFGFETFEEGFGNDGAPFSIIGKKNALYLCIYEHPELEGQKNLGHHVGHVGIHVDNFDEVNKILEAEGVKSTYGDVDWPKSKSIYINDPSGHEIELSNRFGGGL